MLAAVSPVPLRSLTVTVSALPSVLRFSASTPLMSIVMLATSRNSRTRDPLADTSIFSAALDPWKSIASLPP